MSGGRCLLDLVRPARKTITLSNWRWSEVSISLERSCLLGILQLDVYVTFQAKYLWWCRYLSSFRFLLFPISSERHHERDELYLENWHLWSRAARSIPGRVSCFDVIFNAFSTSSPPKRTPSPPLLFQIVQPVLYLVWFSPPPLSFNVVNVARRWSRKVTERSTKAQVHGWYSATLCRYCHEKLLLKASFLLHPFSSHPVMNPLKLLCNTLNRVSLRVRSPLTRIEPGPSITSVVK